MVVLHEHVVDPELRERVLAVDLLEEAARVAVDDRLDQDRPVQVCGQCANRGRYQPSHPGPSRTGSSSVSSGSLYLSGFAWS